jgi:hypothetical protein
MSLNRGRGKDTFVFFLERLAMLGTLGGAGLGILNSLGGTPPEMLLSAAKFGLYGFVGGSVLGALLGLLSALYMTIFRR